MEPEVVVVGQIARDLVLRVPEAPEGGASSFVRSRREMLGGKGANQAVGFAQLGVPVAVLGVVGEDSTADALLDQARADGVDVSHVARRAGAETALIVDIVDDHGQWRYLEHLPEETLTRENDVFAASALVEAADSVVVQLQQPATTALLTARMAHASGARVVLDGAPQDGDTVPELLSHATVVRADSREAELLTGTPITTVADAVKAADSVLARGPSLVVFEVAGEGNVFAGPHDYEFLPLIDTEIVDTTGSGDALVATLTAALTRGDHPREAARLAVAAAAETAGHPGGRPQLRPLAD